MILRHNIGFCLFIQRFFLFRLQRRAAFRSAIVFIIVNVTTNLIHSSVSATTVATISTEHLPSIRATAAFTTSEL